MLGWVYSWPCLKLCRLTILASANSTLRFIKRPGISVVQGYYQQLSMIGFTQEFVTAISLVILYEMDRNC